MSTIGKFFVVLNLVLSGLFVGVSASLIGQSDDFRKDFESEVIDHAATVTTKDGEAADLKNRLQSAEAEKNRYIQINSTLEGEKSALTEGLLTEQQKNSDMTMRLEGIEGKLSDLEGTNRAQTNRITDLTGQNETLRGERDSALDDRDAANSNAIAAEESMKTAERALGDSELALARETARGDEAEASLDALMQYTGIDPATINNQPQLEGIVLSTEEANGTTYVVINIGKKDGVKAGYTFDVYNGSAYKGRIKVQTVNESKSAATLEVPGTAALAQGDRIATRL
jgi:hypothetical protein